MGAVWRLETRAGVFAAKEAFWTPPDEQRVRLEIAFRAACGVRSPEPLTTPAGAYVADGWRLYEWVDGTVPGDESLGWLAEQAATMHKVAWTEGPLEPQDFYCRVHVDWPALAEREPAVAPAVPRLVELTELVNAAPVDNLIWCHRDLAPSNVLIGADGPCLVDWDNVGPMSATQELSFLLINHLTDEHAVRRIVAAYRSAGGPGLITEPEGFAAGLAIMLNYLHVQVNDSLDPELAAEHREFARSQIVQQIRSVPAPGVLERAAAQAARL
ncbi:phosphotransferase [Kribbella sp. ALI-6-A]|uniref:phosphotransferase n=1 Tax=Kribbella sp. ALI-6-A TaxID=1933817 RepID=UPI00097C6758|nr:aminoglycoside phosphotransferase family protein [Kribbella sp. ALI-6-A]